MQVGRLLKADGLLLLTAPTTDVCAVRLLAVGPGVVLWVAEFQAPGKPGRGAVPWPELVAASLDTYLPKLSVKPGAAIPLSLLRLRPLFNTPRLGEELASDVNRLLLLRLLREPAFYVLEREKLMHARDEAFLAGQDADTFWAGSYVVDGRVRYDLVQTNRVTCMVSIRPPATGTTAPSVRS